MDYEVIVHVISIIVPFLTLGIISVSLRLLANKHEADDVKKKAEQVFKKPENVKTPTDHSKRECHPSSS